MNLQLVAGVERFAGNTILIDEREDGRFGIYRDGTNDYMVVDANDADNDLVWEIIGYCTGWENRDM